MSADGQDERTATAELGIAFFGRATAGLTHELKNGLAMINEFNELIGDLIAAHECGQPLNLERIKMLVGDIRQHVVQGRKITAKLEPFRPLCGRAVGAGGPPSPPAPLPGPGPAPGPAPERDPRVGVPGRTAEPAHPAAPAANPAWQQGLDVLLACLEDQKRVVVSLREKPDWAWVDFSCAGTDTTPDAVFCFDAALVEALGARPEQSPQRGPSWVYPAPRGPQVRA